MHVSILTLDELKGGLHRQWVICSIHEGYLFWDVLAVVTQAYYLSSGDGCIPSAARIALLSFWLGRVTFSKLRTSSLVG